MKKTAFSDTAAFLLFVLAVVSTVFMYGYMVSKHKWPPAPTIESAIAGLKRLVQEDQELFRPHHLEPVFYDFAGARIHHEDSVSHGLTLVTSHFKTTNWKAGARLLGLDGTVLHEWTLNPARIWPDSPHADRVEGTKNGPDNYIHGTYLFENGDLLFNIEYMGMARVNSRSEVLWTLPYRTHHSIYRDENGNFWACGIQWIDDDEAGKKYTETHYPGLKAPFTEEHAVCVSPEGQILEEINITLAVMNSPLKKMIWRSRGPRSGDVLHVNDVETLPTSLADQYPDFNAGDVLVCARTIHSIFVIDRDTHQIKWSHVAGIGPHDPDFFGENRIGVFDNNTDHSPYGTSLGGSSIIELQPGSPEKKTLYASPETDTVGFYTPYGGKWQKLPNGNYLITEARRGRVFETSSNGTTVWEWVNQTYNENLIPEVLEGTRYPLTTNDVEQWK